MKTNNQSQKFYRIAVNLQSEIYRHLEPCGDDIDYATKEFNKACEQADDHETVELQEDNYTGNWVTIANRNTGPAGYGENYDRPLKEISDEALLNKINIINNMGLIEIADVRNELVARRYTLFKNVGSLLDAAIKPYYEAYKSK